MKKLLVFDLDGTLIDSVGGIAAAVNRTRMDFGFSPLDPKIIASFTGDGAVKLMERSLADVRLTVPPEESVSRMVQHYAADPVRDSFLYAGVAEGFRRLHAAGWILTVVSNKPVAVSEKILHHFGLLPYLAENIGGGSGFPLKPEPDALFHLMKKFEVSPEWTCMIGDNHTDLNFASRSGVKSIFCEYGFGSSGEAEVVYKAENFSGCIALLEKIFRETV